ncbi:XdhC family protein [Plantactinospora sp. CA-290183]|uniref:XdhC family protein n=1 Tax=Plantactinospora sp. CA-290183 TaxID=3240006 RepID=UPI003D90CAEC
MREVLTELAGWWHQRLPVGLATVVGAWRSAPRLPGAALLVGPDGSAVGSVSGGCVEAAVYELAAEAVRTGRPLLQRYGVADDDALAVGLTCGGDLDVFVERVDPESFPELGELARDVAAGRPVAIATCVTVPGGGTRGGGPAGATGSGIRLGPVPARRLVVWPDRHSGTLDAALDEAVLTDARALLAEGGSRLLDYSPDGRRRTASDGAGWRVFVSSFAPPPRMLVFGAIDFAAAVARIGTFLGYRVTVCDARPLFATEARFPDADEVVVAWPHRYLDVEASAGRIDARTAVCVLTHDAKFDVPLLDVALRLPLAYLGALGSRRTQADRVRRLRAAGVPAESLARLAAPIGLDLGARTPEETAVSIAAEIVALARGGTTGRLSFGTGPIHRQHADHPVTAARLRP